MKQRCDDCGARFPKGRKGRPTCPSCPSPRQGDVLAVVIRSICDGGCPPTFRRMGEQLGWASPHAADLHVRGLVRKGWLTQESSGVTCRSLHVAGCTWAYAGRGRFRMVLKADRAGWRLAHWLSGRIGAAG